CTGVRAGFERRAGPLGRLRFDELVMPVPPGDCVVVEFNGSGGYGDPLEREPARVRLCVEEGTRGAGAALRHYGVDVDDPAASERERDRIRAERLGRPARGP